ncbi:unnamed protein product [Mytilus edulis]|uniref:Uncharacterized protein n=1 Tax=Mytilus edulis TaxID=6550 RepID=A0A8S3R224_MYTED|nr:unnamed protein product [Mytilus edulis]
MMGKTDGDWRKGCFAMIIGSIRTSIYQIEQCISELLNVNDQLIDAAARDEQEIIRVQTIIPKKTNPEIANLRTNIEAYRQKRVNLIAEISSIKAMPCNHPEALNSRRNRHACDTTSPVITKVVDICHKVAYSSIGIIHRCHTLSAQRASEWAKLSNQDANGKPLTLLELQKQVYNNVKSRTVAQLTRTIFDAGLVNDVDKDGVEDKVEMRKDADNRLFVGHIRGIRLFKTYRSTAHKIRVLKQNLDAVLPDDSGVNSPASEIDSILNDIPLNVMSSLQEIEIASLQSISTYKDDFVHLNIDTYETLDAEVNFQQRRCRMKQLVSIIPEEQTRRWTRVLSMNHTKQ